jgi:hypothetical protein
MRRKLSIFATGLSLLLCVATVALWGRSYFSQDLLEQYRRGDPRDWAYDEIRGAVSERGSIGAGYVRIGGPGVPKFTDRWQYTSAAPANPWPVRFAFLGFSYWNTTLPPSPQRGPIHVAGFTVPHGLFAAVLALGPAVAARRLWLARRRRVRIAAGLCVACGYDMRASRERCSECGAVPETGAAA